ncbi:hypothetical protein [Qipengyuania sp. RANM35]|uniref:hypothetical protein n=1 Tax=Qipengyuania sp. RANM35 TaxID=3068635 RepID=UPI0034DADF19
MSKFGNPRFVVALLLGILIAGAFTVFQFDRAARDNTRMVPLVPHGLGGFADERRAERLLAEDPVSAGDAVSDILRIRPVDVSHLSHFAQWAAEADRMQLASAALSEAAKRGWRGPYVQITVLGSALAEGKYEEAVNRLDAVSRTEADQRIISAALDAMLQFPATHADLAKMIGESDFLAQSTIAHVYVSPASRHTLGELIATMSNSSDALGCDGRGRIASVLLVNGDSLGSQLWPKECWSPGSEGLGFAYPDREYDPRGWIFPRSGGISLRMLGTGALTIENRNFLRRQAASRFLTFAPGQHTIVISRKDSDSASLPGRKRADVLTRVFCLEVEGKGSRFLAEKQNAGDFSFEVPADCKVQHLRVEVERGRVEGLRLAVRDMM